jgi:hypothetical protein
MAWTKEECDVAREGLVGLEAHLRKLETPPLTPAKKELIAIYQGSIKATQALIEKNCIPHPPR